MKLALTVILIMTLTVSCGSQDLKNVKKEESGKVITNQNPTKTDKKNVKQITVSGTSVTKNVGKKEFAKLIAGDDGVLVDVRTKGEFDKGNIPGAVNIDFFNKQFSTNIAELDLNKPVYVYCQSGNRSGKAMAQMKKLGFKEVYNLQGGYGGWINN